MPSTTIPRRTSISSFASAKTLVEEERDEEHHEERRTEPDPQTRTHKRNKASQSIARIGKRMSWQGVDPSTLAKIFRSFPC
ncbi:hypothetical protein FHL15_002752 [Xylaria flabelliformis]|uniref:Uncharacterized protein n=1 Tax=Xylaria flabelliformis TaxID=2512241 RepID=A0A553I8F0_9PEZI|nr:hypothetical protein FHL15_002752 [Xylaria flabelliformis]